jgi:folate-binding protein YgfZ
MADKTSPALLWQNAALVRIVGPHAKEFLQGYLSSNTDHLKQDSALPMTVCNLQGRVVASGWALETSDGTGLLVHTSLAQTVVAFLRPYVTFSNCDFASNNGVPEGSCLLIDPEGCELVEGLAVRPADRPPAQSQDGSAVATHALTKAGFVFVSEPVSARFLPQMLGLHERGAVDFDKGCYLGQEIVARAQFRGAIKRQLHYLEAAEFDGDVNVGDQTDNKAVIVQLANDGALAVVPV